MNIETQQMLDAVRLVADSSVLTRHAARLAAGGTIPREETIALLEAAATKIAKLIRDKADACDMADDLLPECGLAPEEFKAWREKIQRRRQR